ncbi:MAG: ATP phosphoribosyltransferase regulatory subunit, partial [Candidatus Acidiferrales bacterium]
MAEKKQFRAIKGVRDILPPESAAWNRVEQAAREVFEAYGYGEIRLPMLESTVLFARSVGDDTDIVSKEMFSFSVYEPIKEVPEFENTARVVVAPVDRPSEEVTLAPEQVTVGESISLRPEATASVCRAYIEHGMHTRPGNVKLYYIGPMFRRERPQKGRYRQFYQIGAEVLTPSPPKEETAKERNASAAVDAEVIEMLLHFFARIGLGEESHEATSRPKSGDLQVAATEAQGRLEAGGTVAAGAATEGGPGNAGGVKPPLRAGGLT